MQFLLKKYFVRKQFLFKNEILYEITVLVQKWKICSEKQLLENASLALHDFEFESSTFSSYKIQFFTFWFTVVSKLYEIPSNKIP